MEALLTDEPIRKSVPAMAQWAVGPRIPVTVVTVA